MSALQVAVFHQFSQNWPPIGPGRCDYLFLVEILIKTAKSKVGLGFNLHYCSYGQIAIVFNISKLAEC